VIVETNNRNKKIKKHNNEIKSIQYAIYKQMILGITWIEWISTQNRKMKIETMAEVIYMDWERGEKWNRTDNTIKGRSRRKKLEEGEIVYFERGKRSRTNLVGGDYWLRRWVQRWRTDLVLELGLTARENPPLLSWRIKEGERVCHMVCWCVYLVFR